MIQNWDFNMSINKAIDVLEEYNLSKQEYKDVILSYHIQRILQLNSNSSPQKQFEENQSKLEQQLSLIQSKFQKLNGSFKELYGDLNTTIKKCLQDAQNVFLKIQRQHIPIINECIKKITQQTQQIEITLQISHQNYDYDFDKAKNFKTENNVNNFEKELADLISNLNYYKKRLLEMEENLLIQKNEFEAQQQQIENSQKELQDRFMAILNQED